MTEQDSSGMVHLINIPQESHSANSALQRDFSLDRKNLIGRDILVLGRDDVYHAGFLGKVIDVGNQSIVVRPGPMYRSQRRTYRRYTVNPPIVVWLREAHESSLSMRNNAAHAALS